MPTLTELVGFLKAHNWSAVFLIVVSLLGWVVVRVLKSDTKIPITIPPRWRPILALAFGTAAGAIYKAVADGMGWKEGLLLGLSAGVGSILVQVLGIDVLRGGKDIPVPQAMSVRPPPPPPGVDVKVSVPPAPKTPRDLPSTDRRGMSSHTRMRVCGFALLLSLPACGLLHAAVPVLTDVLAVVSDASQLLDIIDRDAHAVFAVHPELAREQAEFESKMRTCRLSLDAATRLARAGQEADKGKIDAAFIEFRQAYVDVTAIVGRLGMRAPSGKIAAGAEHRELPEPIALTYRAPR